MVHHPKSKDRFLKDWMMARASIEQHYKGYRLSGDADPVSKLRSELVCDRARVGRSVRQFNHLVRLFQRSITHLRRRGHRKIYRSLLAEISVDNFLPPVEFYLTPMNTAWAVTIVRRAAEECKEREIRRAKLYEALESLEKNIDAPVLLRQYRRALQGDRPEEWQKEQLHQILRAAVVGIQRAAAASLLKKMNGLSVRFRENRAEIDNLRRQLSVVRNTVRR
jgi:uncharacterized NAD(P)/FAD-binding protein YdhS